jgi:hypothetical protein
MEIRAFTIPEVVERCGGPEAIAAASQGRLTHWAVYKWAKNGIPEDRWDLVMELAKVSVEEIYAANQALRRGVSLHAAETVAAPLQAAE